MLWLTPAMDRLWLEGAAERRRFLDRVTLSLNPAHAEAALGYDKALRERNRLIRDGVRDAAWYEALEARLAEFGARLHANRLAALARLDAGAGRARSFPRAELTLEREGPRDAAGLAAALREGRARDMAAGRRLTGPHRDDLGAVLAAKGVAARLASTGEQKALLISLILANAHAVAARFRRRRRSCCSTRWRPISTPSRRAALYDALPGLGAQAFLTGTGPELFGGLDASRLRVEEVGGESRILRRVRPPGGLSRVRIG